MGDHDQKPADTASIYRNESDAPPPGAMTFTPYKNADSNVYQHGSVNAPPTNYRNAYQHGPINQPSASIAPIPSAPPPAPVPWVEEDQPSNFKLKQMQPMFRGENDDATIVRGSATNLKDAIKAEQPNAAPITSIGTHYMSDEQRKATEIGVANGKILDASGNNLDTTSATGTGTANEEAAQKHIFVMTAQGDICQADPWAAKKVGEKQGQKKDGHAEFVNHSSFKRGMAVAGAGEMRVEDGQLQQLSDQSGHYKTDGKMVGQTLDQLDTKGVNMDKTSLKFVDKDNMGDGPMYCSPAQFREHDAEHAEDEIRLEKEKLKSELTKKVGERQKRLGLADSIPVKEAPAKVEPSAASSSAPASIYRNAGDVAPVPPPGAYRNANVVAPVERAGIYRNAGDVAPVPSPSVYRNLNANDAPAPASPYRNAGDAAATVYPTPVPSSVYRNLNKDDAPAPASPYRNAGDAGAEIYRNS